MEMAFEFASHLSSQKWPVVLTDTSVTVDETATSTSPPTVFIIEDEPAVRTAVKTLSESLGFQVQEFEKAEEFLSAGLTDTVGCIVADIRLGGMSGVELLEAISDSGRRRPMVIITGFASTPTVVRAMRNGAITVLDKPFNPEELRDAIKEAVREDELGRAKHYQLMDLKERFAQLTTQERIVLKLIVSGYINKQISKQLDVSVRTVESRRQQIFRKTGAKNLGELMWHAMMLRSEGHDWFTEDAEQQLNSL